MTSPNEPARRAVSLWASLALSATVVVVTFSVATMRETAIGESEIAAADDALKANDWPRAILHAKAAAQATALRSPWPEQGERRLQGIAHDAETRGDASTALHAYGALRAAALSTNAPDTSARWRKEAEAGLVRVATWERKDDSPAKNPAPGPAADRVESGGGAREAAAMREALARNGTPSSWPFAVLGASTAAFVGAGLWLAFGARSKQGVRIAQGILALAVVASGAVLLAN